MIFLLIPFRSDARTGNILEYLQLPNLRLQLCESKGKFRKSILQDASSVKLMSKYVEIINIK